MRRQDLIDGTTQPGGRAPAPGGLRLVQDFVNTVDREHGVELLDTRAGLRAWLAHRDLDAPVSTPGLLRALELREALRALLLANGPHSPDEWPGPAPAQAASVVTAAAARAGLRPRVVLAGGVPTATLVPSGGGLDAVLGTIVATTHTAMTTGDWVRLKACPRDVCGWAFHDRSPGNNATWCSMQVCGNRTKSAAYYGRRRRG